MRVYIASILIILSINLSAQEYEFNVERPKVEITTSPSYGYLYQNISHPINITVSDSNRNFRYELAGGEFLVTDTGSFLIPHAKNEANFNIYEQYKGTERLVYSINYVVFDEVKAYLRGKPSDVAMLDVLLLSGKLEAVSKAKNKLLTYDVKSFTLIYKDLKSDGFISLDVEGNSIPITTRKIMVNLPDGSLIYYENIKVELENSITATIAPYRVTMQTMNAKGVQSFD
ncbi:hypothetical protein FRY74_06335 [Vicingus serpentipes]|uniref:Uncharacterized protein n=1 Tax=Vicingus serpentipes TaxID=1926625 RepID=A0A5C6RVR5_9FLAO|nr:hypothetical protein [Vicingus serpentipes]TXB66187.1 hypothetical protein FRY74_06335 [Vicingus serpentipes]